MYYLLLRNKKKLEDYKTKLLQVHDNIEAGKTPVFDEMKTAKTNMVETVPYNIILGLFVIFGAILTDKIAINETIKLAIILIINHFFGAVSNFIFTMLKHKMRLNLLKKLNLEPTERIIAAMESLEYQSV